MTNLSRSTEFARVAKRTCDRPEYMGWFLALYGRSEKKTDQDLARSLSLSIHDFHRLRFCLRPRHESFSADVQQIADHFGIDSTSLAKLIRHVDVLEAMKGDEVAKQDSDAGLLVAARARGSRKKITKKWPKNVKRPK
jgi:hypothetical protein